MYPMPWLPLQQQSCSVFRWIRSEKDFYPSAEQTADLNTRELLTVDDYAHHPTEIAATLKAAQHYPHNEIWCVFQPHTYTRTKAFFHEFAEALSHTDHLVLADIYAARETDTLGISSSDLAKEAAKLGTDTHYYRSFAEIEAFLKENCKSGDLLITMGAGDVVKIGEDILK